MGSNLKGKGVRVVGSILFWGYIRGLAFSVGGNKILKGNGQNKERGLIHYSPGVLCTVGPPGCMNT